MRPAYFLLRLGFRLLYHELAFTYDWVSRAVSVGQWRTWQRRAIPRLTGPRVLEMAHGTGNTLIDLVEAGLQPLGLDLSPQMGRIAKSKLKKRGLSVPLVRGRAQALPFASASFPSVVATFPTEYIVDAAAVAEFYRVLQPGGRLVFIPTALITGGSLLYRLAAWLFAVTGQSGPWPPRVEEIYSAVGFKVKIEVDKLERSEVTVVVAERC